MYVFICVCINNYTIADIYIILYIVDNKKKIVIKIINMHKFKQLLISVIL